MKLTVQFLGFMQGLTNQLTEHIHHPDYEVYVKETLVITNQSLDQMSESDPDLLYERLENENESSILTYSEFDRTTNLAVWSCVADFIALITYFSYEVKGEKYLPQTIECVDEETIEDYFNNYKQLTKEYSSLLKVGKLFERTDFLDDDLATYYFEMLFGD